MHGQTRLGHLPPRAVESLVEDPQEAGIALLATPHVAARSNAQELENGLLSTLSLPEFQEIFKTHDG
jgi:hypothetical protein